MEEPAGTSQGASQGDRLAAEDLLPLIYMHLREMARIRLAREPRGQTIQPTALVHEVFLKLTAGRARRWADQRHFLVAAAKAMRWILVDRARARHALRHGGDHARIRFDSEQDIAAKPREQIDWVHLDHALEALGRRDPALAEIVQLRYFAGLSIDQTAEALGRSPRSVDRDWRVARAWLLSKLTPEPPP